MPLLCCSVTKSCSTLWPQGLQHARVACPSVSPGVCSNSYPLSLWCHPTISSSVALFFCLQSFPASGSFTMSWLFTLGVQSIGVSASASVLPMNIQGWFLLRLTGLISLLSKGLSRVFSSTTVQRHQFFRIIFWLKLKKEGKTIRPFRYDLNQVPSNNTITVTNRFKGLDW